MFSNKELLERAKKAAEKAYAPYSKFRVGAAVLLDDGTVVEGCNQECAAYGLCMCAERVALHYAHATYPERRIEKIALYSPSDSNITPCGSCRQVMAELARLQNYDFQVIGENSKTRVSDLLPSSFTLRP